MRAQLARPRLRTFPRPNVRVLSVGVDCVWLGSQAFYVASAFNANIGAWNTARVSDLSRVCAAFRPAAHHRGGRARPVFDAARPLCAAAPPMRAHTRIGTRLGGCPRVYVWLRFGEDGIYVYEYIYI